MIHHHRFSSPMVIHDCFSSYNHHHNQTTIIILNSYQIDRLLLLVMTISLAWVVVTNSIVGIPEIKIIVSNLNLTMINVAVTNFWIKRISLLMIVIMGFLLCKSMMVVNPCQCRRDASFVVCYCLTFVVCYCCLTLLWRFLKSIENGDSVIAHCIYHLSIWIWQKNPPSDFYRTQVNLGSDSWVRMSVRQPLV